MSQHTAEAVYHDWCKLATNERTKFFQLLSSGLTGDNHANEQVFGSLVGAEFTAAQAAEYLDVSMSTFRRYVSAKSIQACSTIGRSDMFAAKDLKAFKKSLRDVKRG